MVDGKYPDFGVVWNYDFKSNTWHISLRGTVNGPDLSVIATKLGGGGHEQASAFTISGSTLKDCFFIIDKKN